MDHRATSPVACFPTPEPSTPRGIEKVLLVEVALDSPSCVLSYAVPEEFPPVVTGMRVLVPLRSKQVKGTVLSVSSSLDHSSSGEERSSPGSPPSKARELKEQEPSSIQPSLSSYRSILKIITPSLPQDLLDIALWISHYYLTPVASVISLLLPSCVKKEMEEEKQTWVERTTTKALIREACEAKRTKAKAQARILEVMLKVKKGVLRSELFEEARAGLSSLKLLIESKYLKETCLTKTRAILRKATFFKTKPKTLNAQQTQVVDAILSSQDVFRCHLIHGVTGSGKTEVYLQCMEAVLAKNQGNVLFLIPEIALTEQTIERVQGRFPGQVAVMHHRLSAGERRDEWWSCYEGKARIVVGTRSSVFAPMPRVSLIIVDEEHDASYKQSEAMPRYHARDVALMRAKHWNCPVLLGSATPSLESMNNAQLGKYQYHLLTQRAASQEVQPKVQIVDMCQQPHSRPSILSPLLLDKMRACLERHQQILLFLNRRGFHTMRLCTQCHQALTCQHCLVTLTYHRRAHKLSCHLCNATYSPEKSVCASCGSCHHLEFRGIGTERIEQIVRMHFPQTTVARMDGDTVRHKGSHESILRLFRSGQAQILIGTQMIAKGIDIPSVTLVGVINANVLSLDFRSSEQIFQQWVQVSGRAGRGPYKGEVVLQTLDPTHPVLQFAAAGDVSGFLERELLSRRKQYLPPFSKLIKVVVRGNDEQTTLRRAEGFHSRIKDSLFQGVELYNVSPCGYAKIKGKFFFQMVLKGPSVALLREVMLRAGMFPSPSEVSIDVDPLSTLF